MAVNYQVWSQFHFIQKFCSWAFSASVGHISYHSCFSFCAFLFSAWYKDLPSERSKSCRRPWWSTARQDASGPVAWRGPPRCSSGGPSAWSVSLRLRSAIRTWQRWNRIRIGVLAVISHWFRPLTIWRVWVRIPGTHLWIFRARWRTPLCSQPEGNAKPATPPLPLNKLRLKFAGVEHNGIV